MIKFLPVADIAALPAIFDPRREHGKRRLSAKFEPCRRAPVPSPTKETPMKQILLGCAAALALSLAVPLAAQADDPAAQNAAVAHAARVRADADLARTQQATKAAISDSAHSQQAAVTASADSQKTAISHSADVRTHRIATVSKRRQHAIALAAQARKDRIARQAAAEKKAIDAQHS
jgi:hypothetical protein